MDSLPSFNSNSNSPLKKSLSDTTNIQNLSSILNNPHSFKSTDPSAWLGWWSSSTTLAPPDFSPILPKQPPPDISRSDFLPYLSAVSDTYSRFEDIKNHSKNNDLDQESKSDLADAESNSDLAAVGQGEALVACLREVPALYFKEDFALEDGPTFHAACPFSNAAANLMLQEKLSQYLDVVELHLVKEISLRSNSFFEAQGQLEDLNGKIVEGCERIRELKETIRVLDKDLVESAREIHELNVSRGDLVSLQNKLRLILYVNQALSTLKLLVASADCAGALDVTDDLQQFLDGDELTGLHCFRHLRDHVAAAIESINSILSAEFMRASIHGAGDKDLLFLSKAKARDSIYMNGIDEEQVKLDDEEMSNFRDHLLPLIVGLLRTAKLPPVLRIYRDTLTASMKTTIKNAVAELLPTFSAQSLESDLTPAERTADTDGGGLSLASKLRSLSSENFVLLLSAIFNIVQAHLVRAAEVKRAIEWIMCSVDGHYAADSVAAAIAVGAAAAETAHESDGLGGSLLPFSPQRSTSKFASSQLKANDAASPSNISRNFRADVLRENAEAVFAACDAAHGRWAKLLGVRALLHPKLRLVEFLSIYNITQDFITATEKIGGRLGYSIRGTMQSQAKAFVDFQHEMRMTKIRAVLDQEMWVEVDVPDEFQAIVASLFYSESVGLNDTQGDVTTRYGEVGTGNDGSLVIDAEAQNAEQELVQMNSTDISLENTVQKKSTPSTEATESNKVIAATSSAQSNNHNVKERGKSTSQTLSCGGVGYHMVNCGLILLKMLSEYMDMNNFLPTLSSEVVHRVVEILKFFNTRTCQLILGAGAMQVSGLKSITSKHLALASQVIGFVHAIIPEIRRVLFLKVPEARKVLLLSEIDRVAQDYKVHQEEILTKLVQIMRERLLHHLRSLPQIVESWNRPVDTDSQPSPFALTLVKEVTYLQRILSRTLHEADIQAIFRQVVTIFHKEISEAFSRMEISSQQAKFRLHRDITFILGCIRSLPSGNLSESGTPNWGQLDEFLVQRFGSEAG
ncbi:vacuolar protein sorting-associated protein 54, chloroplastic-like isoform X1 [Populus nigra]|uniref:vacuolar protein sorting-associated protein 54, chloroplastic-like isoform X1 n=1 Tax=Populus nigra TaxID=3691 RepID=UPI002B271D96|nr:vacuolar protein sorting-associated protein 54, chloroplastic-like isoform X1 [Populus nigra]XP_061984384.1 vacuolar protein sorting-associated protein 54, chloroplastic-like isoform X1 [Populus nigra]